MGATNIPAGSLDVALLINTLFQSKADDKVIKEAFRLLKDGGKMMIIDWAKAAAPFGPPLNDRTDPQEIKKFSEIAGFSFVDDFSAGPYHYGMTFIK